MTRYLDDDISDAEFDALPRRRNGDLVDVWAVSDRLTDAQFWSLTPNDRARLDDESDDDALAMVPLRQSVLTFGSISPWEFV